MRPIALGVDRWGKVGVLGHFGAHHLGSAAEEVVVARRFGVAVVAAAVGWGRVRMMAVARWRRVC
jgi:hypothetical protein